MTSSLLLSFAHCPTDEQVAAVIIPLLKRAKNLEIIHPALMEGSRCYTSSIT
jgi:hypothetical protein